MLMLDQAKLFGQLHHDYRHERQPQTDQIQLRGQGNQLKQDAPPG